MMFGQNVKIKLLQSGSCTLLMRYCMDLELAPGRS